ncbi:hypothetical protein K7432_013638, partial [Basidiobolus ranarum]
MNLELKAQIIKLIQRQDSHSASNLLSILTKLQGEADVSNFINSTDKHGDTMLHFACRAHNMIIIECLIEKLGADISAINEHGRQPLHESVDSRECVQYLLSRGALVDCTKRGDWTCLHISAMKGNLSVVKLLAEHGAIISFRNRDGWNALHLACREGHIDIVEYLLSKDSTCWNNPTKNGRYPVHTAALYSHLHLVKLLLNTAPDTVSVKDNGGLNVLQNAVIGGNPELVRVLVVQYHADMESTDNIGRSPLHHACLTGHLEIVEVLVELGVNVAV